MAQQPIRNFGSVTKISGQPPGLNTGQGTGGNAAVGDVLLTRTFTNDNGEQTGQMTNKVGSATIITPSTSDQTIAQGYYGGAAGDGKVLAVANASAGNIKSGVVIAGVTGTYVGGALNDTAYQVNFNLLNGRGINTYNNLNGSFRKLYSTVMPISGTTYVIVIQTSPPGGGVYCDAQVYKNGVAYGTHQRDYNAISFSQQLAFQAGDTCELWASKDSGSAASASYNIYIYSDSWAVTSSV